MQHINRGVVVIKPKQPFVDWANAVFPNDTNIEFEEFQEDCTAYLVSDLATENIERFLKKHWREIYTYQLYGWCTDESTWPEMTNFRIFRKWFCWQIHSEVIDLFDHKPLHHDDSL